MNKKISVNEKDALDVDVGDSNEWLKTAMPPGFFAAMRDEQEALAILGRELGTLRRNQHLVLADRPKALIMANRNTPGSLYEALTLRAGPQRAISYAMFAHSESTMPGLQSLIEKEAKRCKTILDNLLKFTRKEGFQFEPVRLHNHINVFAVQLDHCRDNQSALLSGVHLESPSYVLFLILLL